MAEMVKTDINIAKEKHKSYSKQSIRKIAKTIQITISIGHKIGKSGQWMAEAK
ncbi:MAG: hypothetical protein IPN72_19905 [Saprospiraceae bacterium]|nr:hypothetical protein [Saprospiraceae bacterium]